MRILGLIVSLGVVLYLATSVINKQSKPEGANRNLLDKPAEVRNQVNKALDDTEKARQKAITESQN